MNTITKLLGIVLFLFTSLNVIAQTYTDENEYTDRELQESNTMNATLFQSLGINNETNTRNTNLIGNSINLKQIGDYNVLEINSSTTASDIEVTQTGDFNLTSLEYKVNTVVADLKQNGDYNTIRDYVYNSTADVSLILEQDGDNLTFERFGSNNLTKSLRFRQTEASPSIIIRSFQ